MSPALLDGCIENIVVWQSDRTLRCQFETSHSLGEDVDSISGRIRHLRNDDSETVPLWVRHLEHVTRDRVVHRVEGVKGLILSSREIDADQSGGGELSDAEDAIVSGGIYASVSNGEGDGDKRNEFDLHVVCFAGHPILADQSVEFRIQVIGEYGLAADWIETQHCTLKRGRVGIGEIADGADFISQHNLEELERMVAISLKNCHKIIIGLVSRHIAKNTRADLILIAGCVQLGRIPCIV